MKKLLFITLMSVLCYMQNIFAADDKSTEQRTETIRTTESSHLSRGGFFLEPILFVSKEDSAIKSSQLPIINDDTTGNSTGYGVGLRLGGHVSEILLLGVDARYAKMQTDDSFYNNANADVYNIAPMIGLQTPFFGIRLLAGYVAIGESNPTASNQGVDLKFKEASGLRLGAGVYIAAISINLEYQDLTYNKTEIESYGSVAVNNTTSIDATTKGYTVSLSFPVEF